MTQYEVFLSLAISSRQTVFHSIFVVVCALVGISEPPTHLAKGMKCGVALRPATDVDAVLPLLDEGKIDMVLVMSVEPGFGGQSFLPGTRQQLALVTLVDLYVDV